MFNEKDKKDIILKKTDTPGNAFDRLIKILTILRSPEGCPWDREQTINPFYKNLLEESYEYIDACTSKNVQDAHEELGDVFLVASMLSLMHQEDDSISINDILDNTSDKLIRRHPHVFEDAPADNSNEVIELWDSIKENIEGKSSRETIFSHITKTLPPLDKAYEIQKKASKKGFDWDEPQEVIPKITEEIDELKEAVENGIQDEIEEELGDILFSIVNLSRHLKIQPSIALHKSNNKFMKRFDAMKKYMDGQEIELKKDNQDKMETVWNKVKNENKL